MEFFASMQIRRSALALGLCVLAVLFALEAKFAWYGPTNGPVSEIQSEKARPADLPEVVAHGISSHASAALPLALIFFASFAAITWKAAEFLLSSVVHFNRISVSSAPYFYSSLFFRPPPAL